MESGYSRFQRANREGRDREEGLSAPLKDRVCREEVGCTLVLLRPFYAGSFSVPKLLGSLLDTLASSAIMRTYTSHLPTHVTFSALTALSL
jgi:hypothetical protein